MGWCRPSLLLLPLLAFTLASPVAHGLCSVEVGRLTTSLDGTRTTISGRNQIQANANGDNQYNSNDLLDQHQRDLVEEHLQTNLWNARPFVTAMAVVRSVVEHTERTTSQSRYLELQPPPPMLEKIGLVGTSSNDEQQEPYEALFDTILIRENRSRTIQYPPSARTLPANPTDTGFKNTNNHNNNHKDRRRSFALTLAYRGDVFCGWQRQSNDVGTQPKPSVQQTLEEWLKPLYKTKPKKKHAKIQNATSTTIVPAAPPPLVNIRVCGRTDAGVHAIGQVARFRTTLSTAVNNHNISAWDEVMMSLLANDHYQHHNNDNSIIAMPLHIQLHHYINQHPLAGTAFTCTKVTPVSSKFHPTFGATCRAYVYLVDFQCMEQLLQGLLVKGKHEGGVCQHDAVDTFDKLQQLGFQMNTMFRALVGRELNYIGMSYGRIQTQTTNCTLHMAKVSLVQQRNADATNSSCGAALCIQLVGDRFLRRMVRILVATALREAVVSLMTRRYEHVGRDHDNAAGQQHQLDDTLLHLLPCRDLTAKPTPPQGLIFVGTRIDNSEEDHTLLPT